MKPKGHRRSNRKRPQPGPTQEDIAASQQLTPEQRAEMIRGMVERLADRLKTDGSDFDGWVRLVRAYVVMGDADKAREALTNARNAVGDRCRKAQSSRCSRGEPWV